MTATDVEKKEAEVKLALLAAIDLSIKNLQQSHDKTYLTELAGYSMTYAAINKSLLLFDK